jgi:hypothetical protein
MKSKILRTYLKARLQMPDHINTPHEEMPESMDVMDQPHSHPSAPQRQSPAPDSLFDGTLPSIATSETTREEPSIAFVVRCVDNFVFVVVALSTSLTKLKAKISDAMTAQEDDKSNNSKKIPPGSTIETIRVLWSTRGVKYPSRTVMTEGNVGAVLAFMKERDGYDMVDTIISGI